MKLGQAIKSAKRIVAQVHVSEGWSHNVKISKKDALEVCKQYLNVMPDPDPCFEGEHQWSNDQGAIIAQYIFNADEGAPTLLQIGR